MWFRIKAICQNNLSLVYVQFLYLAYLVWSICVTCEMIFKDYKNYSMAFYSTVP